MSENNPCHKDNIPRLNRISGQIEGIKKMIDTNRNCTEIISQLRAVRSAIKSVETNILRKHLTNCVIKSFENEQNKDEQINELINIFSRFDD